MMIRNPLGILPGMVRGSGKGSGSGTLDVLAQPTKLPGVGSTFNARSGTRNVVETETETGADVVRCESFFRMANLFYTAIGMQAYERRDGRRRPYLLDVVFFVNIVNMNFVLGSELIYVFLALKNGNNFVEATMNLSYIGFVFVGDIKIWSIWYRKRQLTQIIRDVEQIYPTERREQSVYGVRRFLRSCNAITFGFAIIHLILIWTYNLFAMLTYLIYDYWLQQRVVPRSLPYYCYIPWDWHDHWSYYVLYASQNLAGHTCTAGQLASDIMMCATVTQIIMHYQHLAHRIREFVPEDDTKVADAASHNLRFLASAVDYHQKILHLSESTNDVFGVSLLVNFFSSSFVMCFLGFQMTVGVKTDALIMLLMFIFCSLVQVYMITNYAQDLIIASEGVGHAVYNHNWQNADIRYKKMLVLIVKRAQKPAILKATSFLNISLGTMTDLLQLSYKFFALLRTMYSK